MGISDSDGINQGASTLYTGHSNYKVATLRTLLDSYRVHHLHVLRMDVEGAEWGVLEQWTRDQIWPRVNQLLLEVHMWDRGKSAGGLRRWATALNAIPMKVFHTAKNTNDGSSVYIGLTAVWELAFFASNGDDAPPRKLSELTFSDVNEGKLLSDIVIELFNNSS